MRCTPSHLSLPYLAVGIFLQTTLAVCLIVPDLLLVTRASRPFSQALVAREAVADYASLQSDSPLAFIDDATFWSNNSWRIIIAAAIVAIQSLLIIGLLVERRQKRMAAKALARSEERYRNVVEAQTDLICRYLPDTTLIFVNDAYCKYFGKTHEELIGSKFISLIPEVAREASLQHIESLISNPRTEAHEHEVIRPDGSVGWHQWLDHVISDGRKIELQGIGRDITDRKRAEQALISSEEFNRQIVQSSSDCVKVLDLEGNLIFMSERGQRLLEIDDIDDFIGTSWIEFWQAEDRQLAREAVIDAREVGLGAFRGFSKTLKNTPRWWHTVITPMHGANGKVDRLLAVSRDVTERELAVQAMQESEERFGKAFRANPQPMALTTLHGGTYIDVNDSFLKMSGYEREEVIGRTTDELRVYETPEMRSIFLVNPLIRSGSVRNLEMKFRRKTGEFRVLLSSAELLELNGDSCILVASSDISERKALEENLRLSEREFSTLVQNSPDVIARLDRNLRYIYISPSVERITGVPVEEFTGKKPRELSPEVYDPVDFESYCLAAIAKRKTITREVDYRGKKYWTRIIPEFSSEGFVESLMTITEDVTDRVRSEQELARLTVRLLNLQDEERRRIARELHDGSAQNLFAVSVNLAKLSQLNSDSEESRQLTAECQSLCDQSLQEIRTLSYLLHPPLLDQAGLVSALQWYVEGFTKRSGIYVDVYAQQVGRLPAEVEMAFFRIVQEALTNVRRHSSSETASIRLEKNLSEVILEIRDQGLGLAASNGQPSSNVLISVGVGIPGMRQRLTQLGGTLDITSSERGTTISAVVPLRNGVDHVTNTSGR
jgi:PAS domain S-box-containing protein